MVSSLPARSESELTPEERARLDEALRRLGEAVKAYEPFVGRELEAGAGVPIHTFADVADAQAAVEAAESELWRLREELLGWSRPSWVPSATLVADWFSDEDAIYDEAER